MVDLPVCFVCLVWIAYFAYFAYFGCINSFDAVVSPRP